MSQDQSSKIGVTTATIVSLNAMIGAGIFTAPAALAAHVGPAGILAYVFVVIAVWFMAASFARVAELYPEEGSFYTYVKQWAGKAGGLIAGVLYLVGLVVAMGLLAQFAGIYLHKFIPNLDPIMIGLVLLGCLTILNLFGARLSEIGQQVLIVCTLFPIIAITIICFFHADPSNLTPFAPYGFANVWKATRFVIFGFFGFEAAASLFSIVKDPEKNVPKALTYSIAIIGAAYILFVFSIILAIPLSLLSDPTIPISEPIRIIFPHHSWLVGIIHISILSAIVGTLHSMIWSAGILLISLMDITFPRYATRMSVRRQQQWALITITGGISLPCIFLKNLNLFFSCTAVCIVLAYILSIITLLTLPQEWRSGRNIITIIGLITAFIILYFAFEGIVTELYKLR